MSDKQLSIKGNASLLGATIPNPADFPIGSPQSRAAARALAGLSRLQENWNNADEACAKWILSHKTGPMYWARNWTKTENYQWKEQGREPIAPLPYKPFRDREIDVAALPFPHDFTLDDPPDYLDVLMGYLLNTKELYVPKTREMLTSWLVVHYIVWMCQFWGPTEWISQSEDDRKAQGLIKYANILYSNQDAWLKERHPLRRGADEGTLHKIEWANGSVFTALPSGERKLASAHPHGYFSDETAHQPNAQATIDIARPAVRQIVCVSSVAPGWFWDLVSQV